MSESRLPHSTIDKTVVYKTCQINPGDKIKQIKMVSKQSSKSRRATSGEKNIQKHPALVESSICQSKNKSPVAGRWVLEDINSAIHNKSNPSVNKVYHSKSKVFKMVTTRKPEVKEIQPVVDVHNKSTQSKCEPTNL